MEQNNDIFSGDVNLLGLINRIQSTLHQAVLMNDISLRFNNLRSFYFILSTEMTTEVKKRIYQEINNIQIEIYKYENSIMNPKTRKVQTKIPPKLTYDLDMLQIKLEEIYNKSGLKKRARKDKSFALGSGKEIELD